jgi:riboflavin synthase
MFTGIIESVGVVQKVEPGAESVRFIIQSSLTHELKIDQSLAHNGICLTVEAIDGDNYQVTAVPETLEKTNASTWKPGEKLNLERAMLLNSRLDGHMVQGHVDTTGLCVKRENLEDSWKYRFSFPKEFGFLLINKGSIAINGISLTCYDVSDDQFSVSIIPYTFHHTNISQVHEGSLINLEFDILGKYISKMRKYDGA